MQKNPEKLEKKRGNGLKQLKAKTWKPSDIYFKTLNFNSYVQIRLENGQYPEYVMRPRKERQI